jgi:hypothetical protein
MHQAYALRVVSGMSIVGSIATHENDAGPNERVDRDARVTRGRSRRATMSPRSSRLEMSVRHVSKMLTH